jgi:plasmid stabilization system protein ParE
MSLPLAFLPEARAEFDQDADWYEKRQPGLGRRFTFAIDAVLARIAKHPRVHRIVLEDVRKAVVSGFPYCIYYREEAGKLVVVSIFHTSRDPKRWQERV